MGDIVTFYSYKGGTGRSMALANVAHIIAWEFLPLRRVLMIDWDLEAPGLHRYFYDQLKMNFSAAGAEKYPESLEAAPGLIDFLHDAATFYSKEYPSGELGVMQAETDVARTAYARLLSSYPLSRYILSVEPSKPAPTRASTNDLYLMKAGNQSSSSYTKLIRTFNWQRFFNDYGSFFTLLREQLAAEYDTVLLDSRTGLTDIGDICVRVMPGKLVGVFVPNEQNLEGLIRVLKGAAEYRMKSRDPRGLLIYPLASRVDATRSLLRNTWRRGGYIRDRKITGYEPRFEAVIKSVYQLDTCDLGEFFDSTQLSYDSDYAFGEEVAARDGPADRLTISYSCANLARYLVDDRAPWERSDEKLAANSPASDRSVGETLMKQRSYRYLWPLVVGMLGLLLAISAPAIENAWWRAPMPGSPVAIGGSFEATPSATTIAGFGVGTATIDVRAKGAGAQAFTSLQFKASRGTTTPAWAIIPRQTQFTATLRSEGLGHADVVVSAAGISNAQAPGTGTASAGPGTIKIVYAWPVALTAAGVGGATLALSFLLLRMSASPFRRPSSPELILLSLQYFLVSLTSVVFYMIFAASWVSEEIRYSLPLIAALAAAGPVAFERVFARTTSILLSQPNTPK